MIGSLFLNEWRALLRDGRGLAILVLGVVLAVTGSWTAASTDERQRHGREDAAERARTAWLEREADNPHSRAHYGDYVFRPSGPLAGLDSGLEMVTGRSVRAEAHRQNAAVHVPQREASSLLRFQRLEPSSVLHLVIPLILVLVGFGAVASERESGRLRLLRVQGARPLSLLFAKSLALWSVGASLALVVVGTHLVLGEGGDGGRIALYGGLELLALWIVAAVVTCVSSVSKRPGSAAAVLIGLWVGSGIVLPRLASMTADAFDPLPSRDAFEVAMREDREQGIDGHNPRDARRLALEERLLDEHGVETKEELPFNLDGLLMQADEEYGDQVWDEHFGELEAHMLRQSRFARAFCWINPLQAVERLSMAIAGTDLVSHFAFRRQAETYRRSLVKSLNDEHAYGGSRTGEWSWKADADFYASFDAFRFEPPPLGEALAGHSVEWLALGSWALAVGGLVLLCARRLERGGAS